MRGRLTPGLALLRATGFSALLRLLWNPITTRRRAGGRVDQPLVLLNASLSISSETSTVGGSFGWVPIRCTSQIDHQDTCRR